MIQVFCDVCEDIIDGNYQEFEVPMFTTAKGKNEDSKDIPIISTQMVQLCPVCAIKYSICARFAFESFATKELETRGIELDFNSEENE